MENTSYELVLIPAFGISTGDIEMEMARRIAAHDPRISILILMANSDKDNDGGPRITVIHLPALPKGATFADFPPQTISDQMEAYYKPIVKEIVLERAASNGHLAGFLLDVFCSPIADIADELGVPSYFMFPTSASTLSFYLHFEGALGGKLPATPYMEVPGFRNPLPDTAWPVVIKNEYSSSLFARHMKRFRTCKGLLVNTCRELEPGLIRFFSQAVPPVYPVGPIAVMEDRDTTTIQTKPLFDWLDAQPPCSVVFLCFGTLGAFGEDQVREVAMGLERSGYRFLWSLRRQPEAWKGRDYDDFNEVLPEGFLERMTDIGRIVRWVPQTKVLAHAAIGAHVSHCGWNSLLESMWSGVPVASWPLFADQHVNAYYWVCEAGLATEIFMEESSYIDAPTTNQRNQLVVAAKVEEGIRRVMEGKEGVIVRKRLAEMSQITKKAQLQGGSSYHSITLFINDVIHNVSST